MEKIAMLSHFEVIPLEMGDMEVAIYHKQMEEKKLWGKKYLWSRSF